MLYIRNMYTFLIVATERCANYWIGLDCFSVKSLRDVKICYLHNKIIVITLKLDVLASKSVQNLFYIDYKAYTNYLILMLKV